MEIAGNAVVYFSVYSFLSDYVEVRTLRSCRGIDCLCVRCRWPLYSAEFLQECILVGEIRILYTLGSYVADNSASGVNVAKIILNRWMNR